MNESLVPVRSLDENRHFREEANKVDPLAAGDPKAALALGDMLSGEFVGLDRLDQKMRRLRFDFEQAILADQRIRRISGAAVADESDLFRLAVGQEGVGLARLVLKGVAAIHVAV